MNWSWSSMCEMCSSLGILLWGSLISFSSSLIRTSACLSASLQSPPSQMKTWTVFANASFFVFLLVFLPFHLSPEPSFVGLVSSPVLWPFSAPAEPSPFHTLCLKGFYHDHYVLYTGCKHKPNHSCRRALKPFCVTCKSRLSQLVSL